ncbi:hypothetical protein MIMGU_mgv1a018826mg [Erythranthe guttata]|uniref:Uncharacterized protein n=1 Tax=Erythranthe guttata TaxID=4155 RepID=A0A022RKD7_ERYGU|nr:hypothetical protein MIMGU_mgv1a018826mg [Erythranthe guttata]
MLKTSLSNSILSNSAAVMGLCRTRRRRRRPKGGTVRLGNRRRRLFFLGGRQVVHWAVVARPFRVLKKMIMEMVANGRLVEAYCWSLPILRPQIFPLC